MSPERKWTFRIEHILDAIARIQQYTANVDEETFAHDSMRVDAVIRNFQVIGEATRHVPQEIRDQYPAIPWSLMQGMRNVLVHDYEVINLGIVWRTIQEKLPPLVKPLKDILRGTS